MPARSQSSPSRSPPPRSPQAARAPAPALAAPRRRELLADHAQRQELVALQPQDRLQPLDVVLAEQAVAAPRALRREQPLVLEVADLRDRDVRELVACSRSQTAPIVSRRSRLGAPAWRVVIARKVSRYLPICSSSPSASSPALDPPPVDERAVEAARSSIVERRRPRSTSTACLRETVTSSRKMSHSGERPIVVRSRSQAGTSPPPGRRPSGRRAPGPRCRSPPSSCRASSRPPRA